VDAAFPLGCLTAVTGVSGAGKSSLVFGTLRRALREGAGRPLPHDGLDGAERIVRVIEVDGRSLGRSRRSNPATYSGVWDRLRQLLAATKEARVRGHTASHFSLNTRGGRCEGCAGQGEVAVDLDFLAGVFTTCEICEGRRFSDAALRVRYRELDAAAWLALSVDEARAKLAGHPGIEAPLRALSEVGLGYLALGRGAHTLSGGEARRVRMARELARPGDRAGALYLLEEPSGGLHPADTLRLLDVLRQLVDAGATAVMIEHDPALIAASDHVIDLGPGAGPAGGQILYAGPPAGLVGLAGSATGAARGGGGAAPTRPTPRPTTRSAPPRSSAPGRPLRPSVAGCPSRPGTRRRRRSAGWWARTSRP